MKIIKEVVFDKMDAKLFKEMPLLLEVIPAFGNKIARILDPFHTEIETIIKNELKKKKQWQIKYNYKNTFYPFTGEEYSSQTKIKKLDSEFIIQNLFNVAKIVDDKWKNYFIVEFGYSVSIDEENNIDTNGIYFSLFKSSDYKTYGGIINTEEFYKSAKKKFIKCDCSIDHPNLNGDSECIETWIKKLDMDQIQQVKNIFIKSVLIPTLKIIK